jgi:hypothetical protein
MGSSNSDVPTHIHHNSASLPASPRNACARRKHNRNPAYAAAVPRPNPIPTRKRASNPPHPGTSINARPAIASSNPTHNRHPPRSRNTSAP